MKYVILLNTRRRNIIIMIYITGDTHADFTDFTNRIEHAGISEGDTAIVCGDFGFTWGRD